MISLRTLSIGMLLSAMTWIPAPMLIADDSIPTPTEIQQIDKTIQQRCLGILQAGLKSDEFWPSMHAAEALTQSGHGAEVLDQLKGRLDQEADPRKRCGLAREQVRAGDKTKVAELQAVLLNADPYGHIHACESLYKVDEVGNAALLRTAMEDETSPVKALMAAAALARHGDSNALSFIRKKLALNDPQSSWVSAWILAILGDQQDLPAIRQGLAQAETARNRAYYEHALALLGDDVGREALLKNLSNADPGIRADAAYMAGDAGLRNAHAQLVMLLDDKNLDVKIRAAQGILALSRDQDGPKKNARVHIATRKPNSDDAVTPTVALTLPPGPGNSRNSEGDFIQTKDGRMLFIYTYFGKGTGDDYDTAELRERVSLDGGKTWSETERAVVKPESGLNVMSVSLLRLKSGEIALFYVAKVSHSDCRPEMRISSDEGQTWGPAVQCITDEVDYYVLNNSRVIQLDSGRIVLPVCLHRTLAEKKNDWAGELMCYLSDDNGKTWHRSKSVFMGKDDAGKRLTVQEPGVVELKNGHIMMFIRSSSGSQMISYSADGGETWSDPKASSIKSPLSPASIKRIPQTGDLLLVWNDASRTPPAMKGHRTPMNVAISQDDGETWTKTKTLYDDPSGWYCYIAIDFVGDHVLLGHCAGDYRKNGLTITKITRFDLDWLYGQE